MKTTSLLALLPGLALAAVAGGAAHAAGYGDDALPSAEVLAFQRLDARLRYAGARIDYDARGCALYRGVAPDGRVRTRALRDGRGRPLCVGRR